jgi:hypothetical protein
MGMLEGKISSSNPEEEDEEDEEEVPLSRM